jgi:hypothetical protein
VRCSPSAGAASLASPVAGAVVVSAGAESTAGEPAGRLAPRRDRTDGRPEAGRSVTSASSWAGSVTGPPPAPPLIGASRGAAVAAIPPDTGASFTGRSFAEPPT